MGNVPNGEHHYQHIKTNGISEPLDEHEMDEMVSSPAYDYAALDPTGAWYGSHVSGGDNMWQPSGIRNENPYWQPSGEEKALITELGKLELKIIKDEELE